MKLRILFEKNISLVPFIQPLHISSTISLKLRKFIGL